MSRSRWFGTAETFIGATKPNSIERLVKDLAPPGALERKNWDSRGESASWARSLPALAALLERSGLNPYVILEYNPYQSGLQRVDVILSGESSSAQMTFVVVELKQWSKCVLDAQDGRVRGTGSAYEGTEGLEDPYRQAERYAQFIRNYTAGMHDAAAVVIHPVAFLHNATTKSAQTLLSPDWESDRRVYVGDLASQDEFIVFLKECFATGVDPTRSGRYLLEAGYHQGPALLEAAADVLTNPSKFPLTDEQQAIFAQIQNQVQAALDPRANRDRAVIAIKGGPGTGKTWIAMHLVGANARARRQVSYATNSPSLRSALEKMARPGLRSLPVDGLVTSARTYHREEGWATPLDILVVDEAHRITEYTVTTGHANSRVRQDHLEANDITQLFELHKSAKVLVLLIDEGQSITPADDCDVQDLEAIAERTGASYTEFELTEQHRSGGSDAYEAWVHALVSGEPTVWDDEANFTVQLAVSAHELESLVLTPDSDGPGRVLAGFCWEWLPWPKSPKPATIDDVPYDITIGGWKARWNLRNKIDGFPGHQDWASSPQGFAQVGSVFTAQGFEFARCGVILGPDFRWDPVAERWIVDVSKTKYGKLASAVKTKPEMEALIRNHYRVLLTRAMKGTCIYSTDAATQAKLAEYINP